MEKFIEITELNGEKTLINIKYIVKVERFTRKNEVPITDITIYDDCICHQTYESYDDVVRKIREELK